MKVLPSLDKDTHAFSSDATFASVVLTLTGSPPRCGASSSPHKVFRPCGGPMCKSALSASSSLAYASMPASSSLPSSDFPSPKSPVEFLRGRNAVGGSAAKMAGWRLPMNRTMPYGIYARKNRMCSCQAKVNSHKYSQRIYRFGILREKWRKKTHGGETVCFSVISVFRRSQIIECATHFPFALF